MKDLYGFDEKDVGRQRALIEQSLGISFVPYESLYWGVYDLYQNAQHEEIKLQPNLQPLDDEPLDNEFARFPLLLYVASERGQEIEAKLRAAIPEIRLLKSDRVPENSDFNFLDYTRTGYDNLADEYAAHIFDELQFKPLDRELLDRFGEMVKPLGVAVDLGCGPGQVARYLHTKGVPVIGVDLSQGMVEVARRLNPEIRFQTGNMLTLDGVADKAWGGIAAFYSIIHIPREQIADALRELYRVLVPGGILFLAFHRGDETVHPSELWGKPIHINFHHLERAMIQEKVCAAGFELVDVVERPPYPGVEYASHRVYLLARKPKAEAK